MRLTLPILSLFLSTPLFGAEPTVLQNVPYSEPRHERQTLDVYSAANGKNRPIVFWIHGGGWESGDKKEVDLKPKACVEKGYVFVSVNYRLLKDQVTIDQMAQDLAKALRWVCDHAAEFGGDAESILISGHSAGAQLAALLCTDERYIKAENLSRSIIKGCVPVDGDTYDVPLQIATVEERRATIYRRKFGTEEQQKNLSPVTHVTRGKNLPPFLILHVATQREVKMQSEKLVKTLEDAGLSGKTYPAEGKTHTTINSELGAADDKPTAAFFEFAARVFAAKK